MKNDRIVLASSYAYDSQILRIAKKYRKNKQSELPRYPYLTQADIVKNQKPSRALSSEKLVEVADC